jgi:flagellar assembly protein FliH
MKNVIDTNTAKNHTIEPYHFKVLGGVSSVHKQEDIVEVTNNVSEAVQNEPVKVQKAEPVVQIDEQQNRFIEELLKKSDELSTNIIKLHMQIEKQEEDFSNRLKNDLERESQNAYEKGYQKAKDDLEAETKEVKDKFLNSINILEVEAQKGNDFLKQVENDLSSTAVEVAREVILKEIKHSSSDIAAALSKKLIEELKDAKTIKLKVNPSDYEALNEIYSSRENIRVDSDSAITKGGVVVLSDVGNLDGNISTRLEKVKNLIENG